MLSMLLFAGAVDLLGDQATFRNVNSVHLKARAVVQAGHVEGVATYEFWGDADGRYKVVYDVNDPALGLPQSYTYGWDGKKYRFLNVDLDALETREADEPIQHAGVPNPLACLAPWLSDGHVRLKDLLNEDGWRSRLEQAKDISTASRDGVAVGAYKVWITGRERLVEEYKGDTLIGYTRVTMPDDLANMGGTVVVIKAFDEKTGQPMLHVHYTVKEIDVNQPISPQKFAIEK